MKTPCFLVTIVVLGPLMLGVSFADEQPAQPSGQRLSGNHASKDRPAGQVHGNQASGKGDQTDGKNSKSKDDGRASEMSGQTSPKQKAILPHGHDHNGQKQVMKNHEVASGKRADNPQNRLPAFNGPHQPGLPQPSTTGKDGLMVNTAATRPQQPAKLPIGSGTTALLPGKVHERTVAAASIGGLAASSAKHSAAAIDGAGMKHKP